MERSLFRMLLTKELEQITEMREQGMTYHQIAKKMGKSYTWVYNRVNDNYVPEEGGKFDQEKVFQSHYVIPWLESQGHKIVVVHTQAQYYQMSIEIDVSSRKEGVMYIWEVKSSFTWQGFQRGIGQLIIHKWGCKSRAEEMSYGLIFPESEIFKMRAPKELTEWIKEKFGIIIEFAPDREAKNEESKEGREQVDMDSSQREV